jgi:gamma-glutamyltranspeptidase
LLLIESCECLGHPTSHALAAVLKMIESNITADPALNHTFINPKTGRIYKAGEQITTMTNLIKTLQTLADAEDPVKEFYTGSLAKQIVDDFQKNGKHLQFPDFDQYTF